MSTPATPAVPGQAAATTGLILNILTVALGALGSIPAIGADAVVAAAFVKIIQAGVQAYQSHVGQPIDLTQIPLEAPLP